MGSKQSSEPDKVEPGSATFQRTSSLALGSKNDEGSKFDSNLLRSDKSRKEQHLINLVLREKHNILKTGLQQKARETMEKGINKQAWEIIEYTNLTEETKFEMISYDLSNSKVYEMLCNSFKTATHLRELILVNCNLSSFPKYLPRDLSKLDLKENLIPCIKFETEPSAIESRPNIQYFDLSSNKLTEIPEDLPLSINYLLLQNNMIKIAKKASFEELNSLQTLNLSGNQIEEVKFTTKIFTCLYDLNLSFNKIKTLPEGFFSPSKTLVTFSVSNNPLICIDNSIKEMHTLQRLDLRSTKLTQLPPGLSELIRLEKLLLDNVFLLEPPMFIVRKGTEEIMNYLKTKNKESSKSDKKFESDHETEKRIENFEEEERSEEELDENLPSMPIFRKTTSKIEKIKLKKEEFKELNNWIIDNLNENVNKDLKILQDFIVDILNDTEADIDKTFFTLNAISKIFVQYIKEAKGGNKKFELSASSSYFLGRVGEYARAVKFLNDLGFQLVSKPFIGLVLTLKSSNQNFQRAKIFNGKLDEMLKILKACRIKEQFVPDYNFRRGN